MSALFAALAVVVAILAAGCAGQNDPKDGPTAFGFLLALVACVLAFYAGRWSL